MDAELLVNVKSVVNLSVLCLYWMWSNTKNEIANNCMDYLYLYEHNFPY